MKLRQQLVLGGVGLGALDETHLVAAADNSLDQKRLVGVSARQAIGRVTEHDLDMHLGDKIAQALKRRADEVASE